MRSANDTHACMWFATRIERAHDRLARRMRRAFDTHFSRPAHAIRFLHVLVCRQNLVACTTMRGQSTRVRPATGDDAELLVAWHEDSDVARYRDDEPVALGEMRDRLARSDVEPVGCLQVHETGLAMLLAPSARRAGAARATARHLLLSRPRGRPRCPGSTRPGPGPVSLRPLRFDRLRAGVPYPVPT